MSITGASLLVTLRRYPFCAGCALVTIVCAVTSWFLWGQNQALEIARQERSKEGEAMLATLVGGSTQRQELAAVREITRRIDDHLVVKDNLAENYWYFFKLQEQTKVNLSELHELNSPITDNSPLYRRIPYTLRVSGTFDQVGPFVLGLETGPRLLRITGFSFTRAGAGLTLDLNLEMLGKK